MDIKVRNKVAEIQQALEQDEQRISLSDPIAKMMLVAMAHQSCREAGCRHSLPLRFWESATVMRLYHM